MTTRYRCKINSVKKYQGDTRKIVLSLLEGKNLEFFAGQYLQIVTPEKKFPFSIANSPKNQKQIELHIKPTPESEDSEIIESIIDASEVIEIEAPLGNCYVKKPTTNPVILLAASTGITQMKSIIEFLEPYGFEQETYLYWGVISSNDLYLDDLCKTWDEKYSNFHYIPVVSEPNKSLNWQGRIGLVGEAALLDLDDLTNISVYVSGSVGMVYATLDSFMDRGMPEENMFSDVFSFAPRLKSG